MRFEPQSLEQLQSRYTDAIMTLWDQTKLVADRFAAEMQTITWVRPGNVRAHVFDHADGWRLIIDREVTDTGSIVLHMSGCAAPGTPAAERISDLARVMHSSEPVAAQVFFRSRFAEISNDDVLASSLKMVMVTQAGAIHYSTEISPAGTVTRQDSQNTGAGGGN